jgi:hypothetical protein
MNPTKPRSRTSALEVVLPEAAQISELTSDLLKPGNLPGLWETDRNSIGKLCAYFAGGNVVKLRKDGYDEPITIPKARRDAIYAAVEQGKRAVALGWLRTGRRKPLSMQLAEAVQIYWRMIAA